MIRMLAALLSALLIPGVAFGQLAYSPFLITRNVDAPDNYVSLYDSETFGPGGSIFDLTDRVAPPRYLGPPSSNPADYETEITTFKDAACSSDHTTWRAFRAALLAASDSTFIWTPQSCHMKVYLVASGDGSMAAISNTKDDIQVYCANPALCSWEIVYYPAGQGPNEPGVDTSVSSMETDGTAGDGKFAIGDQPARRVFDVGTGAPGTIAGQDCNWDPAYVNAFEFGTHVVELDEADCQVTASGSTSWGPGDIARLKTNRVTGYGTNVPTWLGLVACVRTIGADGFADDAHAPDGVLSPNDPTLCAGVTRDNSVRFMDPVPWDFQPAAFYWGDPLLGLGDTFAKHPSDAAGATVYAATSGHVIQQVERAGTLRCDIVGPGVCGNGTRTDNIAENIWFNGIAWTVKPQYVGGMFALMKGVYGGGFYRGGPLNDSGRVSAISFGSTGNENGAVQLHSMDWWGTAGNNKCYGEIVEIWVDAIDVVRFKVAASGNTDCFFTTSPGTSQPNWGEPEVGFSDEVADPRLAGERFLVTREVWNPCPITPPATTCDPGTVGTWTMRINGLSGANPDGTGIPIDTTPGGIASNVDQYGGGSFYWNPFTSGSRVVNSFFHEPMQHALNQGCTGCVYSANHVGHGTGARKGRGPFNHGTGGGCGNIWENSSSDQSVILLDTSNRAPLSHGEGCQNVYYKLRGYDSGAVTDPIGTANFSSYSGGTGAIAQIDNSGTNQYGAANDKWGLLLSSGVRLSNNGTDIDRADNIDADSNASYPSLPYMFYRMAIFRNRVSTGNDLDAWKDPLNPSTLHDISANENGESTTVPTAWGPSGSDEIGKEPSALYLPPDAEFICPGSDPFSIGAYYDTIGGGSNAKLPAEMRYLGEPCPVEN